MSEEAAFLAQLRADPADDVTRLVYADWLEERGDERAAFLRAEQQLAALGDADPRFADLDARVGEASRALDAVAVGLAPKATWQLASGCSRMKRVCAWNAADCVAVVNVIFCVATAGSSGTCTGWPAWTITIEAYSLI